MRHIAWIIAALAAPGVALAAGKPFYGTWACAMVADNAVNVADWTTETYDDAGVRLGAGTRAEALKIATLRRNEYRITYPGGARARITMQQPWLFLRSTQDHAYVCLRKAAP